jgi:GDPmannose 4,6-dehydratase
VGAGEITGLGVTRLLEAVRETNPKIRFYQASTSELYGGGNLKPQTEDTPFKPSSPYASAKLYSYWITRIYREGYGIFACNGILFNHESPLRGLEFVTRKISNTVAKIALGLEKELKLGNLEAKRDWGYAPEYVESMWLILQQENPDDYVIATNEAHSVREFVEKAFHIVGLDWEQYVKVDKRFLRPLDVNFLQGDYAKARQKLGWEPKVKLDSLVELMVKEDINRWERWQKGERFPWDAPNYPSESRILSRMLDLER